MTETAKAPVRCGLSGTALKYIACITMLIDHIGASCIEAGILLPALAAGAASCSGIPVSTLLAADRVLRYIGRLAFPIFCFLAVEGFLHTHDVKRYMLLTLPFSAHRSPRSTRTFTGRWRWACWLWQGSSALKRKTACPAGRGLCGRAAAPRWRWLPTPTTTPSACSSSAPCT